MKNRFLLLRGGLRNNVLQKSGGFGKPQRFVQIAALIAFARNDGAGSQ